MMKAFARRSNGDGPRRAVAAPSARLVVDDDLPASQHGRGICPVAGVELIVVGGDARGLVPNLDAELIRAPASVDCVVHGREPEAEVARTVDRARALVLRLGT